MTGLSFHGAGETRDGATYRLEVAPAYTLAMYVCNLAPTISRVSPFPLVRELHVSNPSTRATDGHVLSLRVSGRAVGDWIHVPPLGPHQSQRIDCRNSSSQPLKSLLQEQTGPAVVPVQLFRGSECVAQGHTLLLSQRAWLNVREHRKLIASFVTPDEREIVDLVAESLGTMWNTAPRKETDPEERARAVRQAVGALYEHVRMRFDIRYREPRRLERDPRTGIMYQTISEPDEVLIEGQSGGATCLDMSVLFASCIEHMNTCFDNVRFSPWIVFTGSASVPSAHALVGCRLGGPGQLDLIEDAARIRKDVESGRLILWETTGVCTEPVNMSLSFDEAVASALSAVSAYDVHAVDIGACRIGHGGTVPPFPEAPRPIVTRAFSRARKLQAEYGLPNVDATTVLFALSFESGTKLEALLHSVGSTCQDLRSVLVENTVPDGPFQGAGGQTRNCRRLWETSFEIARSMGRRNPRECDLLWAVAWSRSKRIRQVLAAVGLPPIVYERELARICPEPPSSETTQM